MNSLSRLSTFNILRNVCAYLNITYMHIVLVHVQCNVETLDLACQTLWTVKRIIGCNKYVRAGHRHIKQPWEHSFGVKCEAAGKETMFWRVLSKYSTCWQMTHLDRDNERMSDTVNCTEFVLVAGSCQGEDQKNITTSAEFKIWWVEILE